nr:MAG TPA: Pectate lyase [Caudoviricetes sp.]
MSTIYDKTDNYSLNLYGDNDPADLRDGYNGSMHVIDTTLKTHLDRIEKAEAQENLNTKALKALLGDNTTDNATSAKTRWDKAGTDATAAKGTADSNAAILAALGVETTQKAQHLNDITKINDYFITPQMFGAKGDGVTDDSPAFNQAIEAIVNTYNVGGLYYTLFVPAGNYLLEHTVTLHSSICIKSLGEVTFTVDAAIGFHVKHINVHLDGKTSAELFDGSNGLITIQPKPPTTQGHPYAGTAISIDDPTSPNFMRGKTFNYLHVNDFDHAFDIKGNDIYLTKFTNIGIANCNYGIRFEENKKNAGENLMIQNSVISCNRECITLPKGFELFISNTSFDFTSTVLNMVSSNNKVVFDNCHFEAILNATAIVSYDTKEYDYPSRNQVIMQNCSIINSKVPFVTADHPNTVTLSYNNTYEFYITRESLTNKDICNDNVYLADFTPNYYIYKAESGGKAKNLLDDVFKKLKVQTKTGPGTLEYENDSKGWTMSGNATFAVKSDSTYGKIIEVSNITQDAALLSPPIALANATRFISGFDAKTATPSDHGSIVLFDEDVRTYWFSGQYADNGKSAKSEGDVWMTTNSMYYYETSCNYSTVRLKIEFKHSTSDPTGKYLVAKPRLFAY